MRNLTPAALHLIAAFIGAIGTAAEGFIGFTTLAYGYWFGVYDVIGTACGLLAFISVWRFPLLAAGLWLVTIPLLWNGRLLVAPACLPVPLPPLGASLVALSSWRRFHAR